MYLLDTNTLIYFFKGEGLIAEKISVLQKYDYLQERAKEGSTTHARSVLGKVPNRKPMFKEDEF